MSLATPGLTTTQTSAMFAGRWLLPQGVPNGLVISGASSVAEPSGLLVLLGER